MILGDASLNSLRLQKEQKIKMLQSSAQSWQLLPQGFSLDSTYSEMNLYFEILYKTFDTSFLNRRGSKLKIENFQQGRQCREQSAGRKEEEKDGGKEGEGNLGGLCYDRSILRGLEN